MAARHRTGRGEERIQALKEAAINIFLDGGYEALSVDGLIAQVGGSRRNVYDRFGGKQGLFTEAIIALCEELSEPLRDLVVDGTDPEKALRVFGRRMIEIVMHPRTLALHRLMIAEGARFPALAQSIWQAGHLNAQQILARWIEDGQKAGLLRRDVDAETLSADFVNLTITTTQLKALIGLHSPLSDDDIADIVSHAVAMFLNGAFQTYHGSNDA